MPGTKSLIFCSILCLSQVSMVACASTEQKTNKPTPVYYSDCGVVNLQNTDGRNMTREELIAAEDNTLLEALDDNSECNQKAMASGQQAVAAAGGSGQSGGTGQNGQQGSGANGQTSQENSLQQRAEQVITSNSGVGGGKTGVEGKEITVCQISQENLAASTTAEDKEFWQGEVDKNCN